MAPATAAPKKTKNGWYELSGDQVAASMEVDPAQGLTSTAAAARLEKYSPNKFAEAREEPAGAPALGPTT